LSPLGRTGDLTLYHATRLPEGNEVLALDRTGAIRWRSSAVACEACAAIGSGVSPDERTCWTTDSGEREWIVRAFECASGRPLFEHRAARSQQAPTIVTGWADPGGIYVVAGGSAALLARDGHPMWRRALRDPELLMVPPGLRVSEYPIAIGGYRGIDRVALDGTSTRIERGELRATGRGIAIAREGATSDRAGASVPAPEVFTFVRDRRGSHAEVGGRAVLSIAGDAWVLGEHRSARGAWLVVAEPRAGQPDRVHVVRAP
jgi:hypothetical protein